MSLLRNQLRKLLPNFSLEANKIKDPAARSRWMRVRKVTESKKSVSVACAANGISVDSYTKWAKRILKFPFASALDCKSRRPHRSPNKTKPRFEKAVLKIRRVEPYLGPDRLSHEVKKIYDFNVPASTCFAILRRAKVVGKKIAAQLTKKHMKRYRRAFLGYLQMDFKYVPYFIEGKQCYQLSCVDHHSSWRLIRNYRRKDQKALEAFLSDLEEWCPFPIIEIQTDNDACFTDKFSSRMGVTGEHFLDLWCKSRGILHRLIPVGVKELNGKVENTHKQDDREFFAMHDFKTYESIELSTRGYSERWNSLRATRALGYKTPNEVILEAYAKALALHLIWGIKSLKDLPPTAGGWPAAQPKKNRTRKRSSTQRYLDYLEWADKKKLPALLTYPLMSQNFSQEGLIP